MDTQSTLLLPSWEQLAQHAQSLGFPGNSKEILRTRPNDEAEILKLRLRLFCELSKFATSQKGLMLPSRPQSLPWSQQLAVRELISELQDLTLERFRVVGAYMRYEGHVRNYLKDTFLNICRGLATWTKVRENHLIWAPSSQGKTFLVDETAALLKESAIYHRFDLSESSREEMAAGLEAIYTMTRPCLCLVDEIDSKSGENWPYEILLDHLLANVQERAHVVFVLAGSVGLDISEFKSHISGRPKGPDLLKRILNEYVIPPLEAGDKILIFLSHLKRQSEQVSRNILEVEKMALYYVALSPKLNNPRQVSDLARRTVGRLPPGEDRVKYDYLFDQGDPENRSFWTEFRDDALVGNYVFVTD